MSITDYDSNAANNTDINGVNIAEGCSPAGINNALREIMADLAGVIDLFFPVGSLYMSSDSANPSLRFPGTTWIAAAEGRAVVGVGSNGESTWSEGQTRGAETHEITIPQLPVHAHLVDPPATNTTVNGDHAHIGISDYLSGGGSYYGPGVAGTTDVVAGSQRVTSTGGAHSHVIDIAAFGSSSVGGGESHNNIQPSKAYYVWERTA